MLLKHFQSPMFARVAFGSVAEVGFAFLRANEFLAAGFRDSSRPPTHGRLSKSLPMSRISPSVHVWPFSHHA